MLDIFVLEEDYFQQARLEDAIHKSKPVSYTHLRAHET